MSKESNEKMPESATPQCPDPLARTALDALSANIAILDHNGVILETNRAWRAFSTKGDMPPDFDYRGVNYLLICDATTGQEAEDAAKVAAGIRSVINKNIEEFLFDYPCHETDKQHWFYMRAIRIPESNPVHIVISHEEITSLKHPEQPLPHSASTSDNI